MSRSGSFGLNPRKTYGTSQSVNNVRAGRYYSNTKGLWLSVVANAAIAQYAFCAFDQNSTTFQAEELTTTVSGSNTLPIGVAQFALGDGELGFLWMGNGGGYGAAIYGKVAASYVALANMYTTATDGVVDDETSNVDLVIGVVGLSTDAGSASSIELFAHGTMLVNITDA